MKGSLLLWTFGLFISWVASGFEFGFFGCMPWVFRDGLKTLIRSSSHASREAGSTGILIMEKMITGLLSFFHIFCLLSFSLFERKCEAFAFYPISLFYRGSRGNGNMKTSNKDRLTILQSQMKKY